MWGKREGFWGECAFCGNKSEKSWGKKYIPLTKSRPGHEIVERRARFSIKTQDNFKLISDYPSDLSGFRFSAVVRGLCFHFEQSEMLSNFQCTFLKFHSTLQPARAVAPADTCVGLAVQANVS